MPRITKKKTDPAERVAVDTDANAEGAGGQGLTRAERRAEAERRLLAAAVTLVADRGTEGTTLADVGEAAGYSRGLPGHYFGTKSDLIAAVASHISDGFANRLAQTSTRAPGLESLLHSVGSYLDGISQREGARALLIALAEALTEPLLNETMKPVTVRSIGRLRTMIEQGKARGEIRADVDAEAQAALILGTLRATVAQWWTDQDRIDLATLRDTYVASLQRSLAA
ncbi:MAG: TetR/AcrR family transcriptional regulator [Reyranella sp.]|uniref:TetR/AcrR family transcriptional regulator n=1 Tax=Reyranella sp. TaxID=1929291 RepID=UPI0025F32BC8|nr:TetR/AcrR family transcriptional regulator [Reyranella sp.]MBR2816576.1 TetR/AcrR family transcriptional regulator [Reyranella sp.]